MFRLIDAFVQSGWQLLVVMRRNFEQMHLSTGAVASHELNRGQALEKLLWAFVAQREASVISSSAAY